MKTLNSFQRVFLLGFVILLTSFSANAAFFFCIDDEFGYHWEARATKSSSSVWVIDGTVDVDGQLWSISGLYDRRDFSFVVDAMNPNPDDCYSASSSFNYDGTLIVSGRDYSLTYKWSNNCGGIGFATAEITPGCRSVGSGTSGSGPGLTHTDPLRVENPFADPNQAAELTISTYPNPFSDQLTVSFSLENDSQVEATVYDLQGRAVKQLAADYMSAGQQQINWNGTDNNGNSLPSGVYVLNLNGSTQTLQLIAR